VEKLDRDVPLRAASANVHSKVFDDEVVILDMKSGTYFSLRGSGVDVWKLIEANASVAMISEALGERYEAPSGEIATALDSLLGELAESGLVVADASLDPSRPAAETAEKTPFAAPRVERFTDMQELLLLDPIHEVDDAGWPHTPMTR
jgi:hypothetical protein